MSLIIPIFSHENLLVLCLLQKKLSFNLTASPFCPAARWNREFILLLHSYHILSYTQPNELFSCLYLWGKQALLRAAPVWSIIKYNATWKCIRHETGAWTSHSGFLLVSHFVPVLMLTPALCMCISFQILIHSPLLTFTCYSASQESWIFVVRRAINSQVFDYPAIISLVLSNVGCALCSPSSSISSNTALSFPVLF